MLVKHYDPVEAEHIFNLIHVLEMRHLVMRIAYTRYKITNARII